MFKNILEELTLLDYFASKAPVCSEDYISRQQQLDHQKNPHNDHYKPKLRSRFEIVADYNYEYAKAMVKARSENVTH